MNPPNEAPHTVAEPAVQAEPPPEPTAPQIRTPPRTAGGPAAVLTAARHAFGEMGAIRSLKVLNAVNQKGGFDCPGCAWPDPDGDRSRLGEYCENGAKAVAEEATRRRITSAFFERYSVADLSRESDHWLGKQGRLTHPMVLREGDDHYRPISWADAIGMVAGALRTLDSPDEAVFYTSGRTSNEAAFLFQLFARLYGTNNLPDCSNMCHESSGRGLKEVIGVGKGTVTLADFDRADVIVVVGQNPGTNHPRMLSTLLKAGRRGARILHINPLPETGLTRFRHPQEVFGWLGTGTRLADWFLQVRINGDVALFAGLMKALLEEETRRPGEVLDHDFIREKTTGFEALKANLEATSWEDIEEGSGITRAEIEDAAALMASTRRIIICWAMGLTQHRNAVANIQMCVNLLLMKGAFGIPGAGACPVRGHSNVQGDRTMGIWSHPSEAFLDRLGARFGFDPPRRPGLDTVAAIEAMHAGRVGVFFALGGNFLSAAPDTHYTAEALRRCRLTVQVSTKLNRSHLVTGREALILPCLGRTERDVQAGGAQFVSVENSMGIVHQSRGTLPPASGHLHSEPRIIADLARATLGEGGPVEWEVLVADYDRIRALIEDVIPGFEQYNERVRQPEGFYLPNAVREGRFETPGGRAVFTVHPLPEHRLKEGELLMMTIRSHDQFNTTIYGLDDRYRGIRGGRRVVFMHPDDVSEAGLQEGDLVDLVGEYEGQTRRACGFRVVPFSIPRRCVATYFPEANVLVPVGSTAEGSNTPASKSVVIRVVPADA